MNDKGELQQQNGGSLAQLVGQVPILVQNSGAYASERFVEYFIGQIRNPNTSMVSVSS